jgi:hypothetical protein
MCCAANSFHLVHLWKTFLIKLLKFNEFANPVLAIRLSHPRIKPLCSRNEGNCFMKMSWLTFGNLLNNFWQVRSMSAPIRQATDQFHSACSPSITFHFCRARPRALFPWKDHLIVQRDSLTRYYLLRLSCSRLRMSYRDLLLTISKIIKPSFPISHN